MNKLKIIWDGFVALIKDELEWFENMRFQAECEHDRRHVYWCQYMAAMWHGLKYTLLVEGK